MNNMACPIQLAMTVKLSVCLCERRELSHSKSKTRETYYETASVSDAK